MLSATYVDCILKEDNEVVNNASLQTRDIKDKKRTRNMAGGVSMTIVPKEKSKKCRNDDNFMKQRHINNKNNVMGDTKQHNYAQEYSKNCNTNHQESKISDGGILEYFSPEELVATSNEDLSVEDVIAMRIA